jgi:F0F1-type ATP synthase membrane subunit b/b'
MSFDIHFWESICFFIFVAAIYKPLKSSLSKYLDEYAESIRKQVAEVDGLCKDAQKVFDYYKEQLEDLAVKISSMNRHTEENIKTLKQKAKEKLEEQIEAKKRIHKEKLELYSKEHMNLAKDAIVQKAVILTGFYMSDVVTPGPTRADIEQLLNAAKNKSITFH